MSFLLNNRETLTQLFTTFSLQEVLLVNQNLNASWHLLTLPPAQILSAMADQKVGIENFVGKKCLPLTRLYLSPPESQKAVFLSKESLAVLFVSLPAVEAYIFKDQIQRAQIALQKSNQALASLLSREDLTQTLDNIEPVVHFDDYQANKKRPLGESKKYLNCFYYLQAGELCIVEEGKVMDNVLLYSELSPLQQLQAQHLCRTVMLSIYTDNVEGMAQQSVSA